MDDLRATHELLSRQLDDAIAREPLAALPVLVALQAETDARMRDAVRRAAVGSSWREIAGALGVSKQAAHQRFKAYATDVAAEMKSEHRTMKQARRSGNVDRAAEARARIDELAAQLRANAEALR